MSDDSRYPSCPDRSPFQLLVHPLLIKLYCFKNFSADHNDYCEWFLTATLRLWYLLSHHDNHHWNIDHTESLSGTVPLSLESIELDVATDRQFMWAVWLYRSTYGNGNQ